MGFGGINLVAVLVAAIASMVVGALWYGPLFGKPWMKLMGYTKKNMPKDGMWKSYVGGLIVALITALVLAFLMMLVGVRTPLGGAYIGFMAGLGFIATSMANRILWGKDTLPLYIINMLHSLVGLMVMGAILGAMA